MKTSATVLALSATLLTACGFSQSNFNPLNWFGRSQEAASLIPDGGYSSTESRPLVQQVSALKIDRTLGGAIIRATGLPPTQGYWEADLLPLNDERPINGVLSYAFHIRAPLSPQPVVNTPSREVVTGYFVSTAKLLGVRQIRVVGAENSRSARR